MRRSTLVLIVAGVLVLGLLWVAVSSSQIPVSTNDADYEATITMHYTDGSTASIKRFKSMTAYHDDKAVDYIEFDLDVKWKARSDDGVRVLSPRDDVEHASALIITFEDGLGDPVTIAQYPLSFFTQRDYSVLEEGEWYHLFKDVKVTGEELEGKLGLAVTQTWTLKWQLWVYYNLDVEEPEYKLHEITFAVPMKVVEFTNEEPDPDGGGGGGGSGDRRDGQYGGGGWSFDAQPYTPGKPVITVKQESTRQLTDAPWLAGGKPKDDATDPDAASQFKR